MEVVQIEDEDDRLRMNNRQQEPSLERLKALDDLPNVEAQLEEAASLCNHAHRADMVARWLVGKLRSEESFQANPKVYLLLTDCVRLLYPSRTTSILEPLALIPLVTKALTTQHAGFSHELLLSFDRLLSLLLATASSSNGVSLRRVLSVSTEQAATFFGAWIHAVLLDWNDTSSNGESPSPSQVAFLDPALRIWPLHQPSSSDSRDFSRHCCFPAALLLSQIDRHGSEMKLNKRRRDEEMDQGREAVDYTQQLERLIVKHMFLESRSNFLKSHSEPHKKASRQEVDSEGLDIQSQASILAAQLKPHLSKSPTAFKVLPTLLNLAIRCVPIVTQNQRSKEAPWVEAAFKALVEHCWIVCGGEVSSRSTLLDMLTVIKSRASLPTRTLKELFLTQTGVDHDNTQSFDWLLVAKIVELDRDVFTQDELAGPLFSKLTAECAENHGLDRDQGRRELLKDLITVPVIGAFAQNRRLSDFIRDWTSQVKLSLDEAHWSVWRDIETPFAELLETHLTGEQIQREVDLKCNAISELVKTIRDDETGHANFSTAELGSAFVVLNALLKGIKRDELQWQMQPTYEKLLRHVTELADLHVKDSRSHSCSIALFSSSARLFNHWFPRWVLQHEDQEIVEKTAKGFLEGALIKWAIDCMQAGSLEMKSAHTPRQSSVEAAFFVGRLCEVLCGYKTCTTLAREHVHRLIHHGGYLVLLTLVAYPNLIPLVDKPDYRPLFDSIYQAGLGQDTESHDQCITEALAENATSSDSSFASDMLTSFTDMLSKGPRQTATDAVIRTILDVVSRMPPTHMSKSLRENVLNVLSNPQIWQKSQISDSILDRRYATILRLMQASNSTADLLTDPTLIWKLFVSGDSANVSTLTRLDMMLEITRLMTQQLLATQDTVKARSFIRTLYEQAQENTVAFLSGAKGLKSLSNLRIATTVIGLLDSGLKGDLRSQVLGDCGRWATSTQATVTDALKKSLASSGATDFDGFDGFFIVGLLECARVLHSIARGENDSGTVDERQQESWSRLLRSHYTIADEQLWSASIVTAHIFRFLCETAVVEPLQLLQAATEQLAQQPSPEEHQLIVKTFSKAASSLDGTGRMTMLISLTSGDLSNTSAISLTCLDAVLALLTKGDIEPSSLSRATSICFSILDLLKRQPDYGTYRAAVPCLLTILREKPFLVTQYTIERTLGAIHDLARPSKAEPLIFLDLCTILTTLLTHHRARLNGRFHILIPVLQALQSRLFAPSGSSKQTAQAVQLSPQHARAFARLLTLLCDPPQTRHGRHKHDAAQHDLVDQTRRMRAQVGTFVPALVHSHCALALQSPLREGMKEALQPGTWAVLGAMEVSDVDSLKVLSAAMNNSERAVLRGLVEEWRQSAKWSGI